MPRLAQWTVMVYLCGDNNLETATDEDFKELQRAKVGQQVNVVVEYDRRDGAQRYASSGGKLRSQGAKRRLNTGDPKQVSEFFTWAMQNYPARRYFAIFSGMGLAQIDQSQVFYLCYDESENDALDAVELKDVFSAVPQKRPNQRTLFDIVAFDICVTSVLELAHQCRHAADVFIGSQGIVPSAGWCYDRVLATLARQPSLSPIELADRVVDNVHRFYTQRKPGESHTISALNLTALHTVTRAVDLLSLALLEGVGHRVVYEGVQKFFAQAGKECGYDLIDLHTASAALHAYCESDAVRHQARQDGAVASAQLESVSRAAQRVLLAVEELVLAEAHVGREADNLRGVSVYFPSGEYARNYAALDFSRDTHWASLLSAYNLIRHHPRRLWRVITAALSSQQEQARQGLLNVLVGPEADSTSGEYRLLFAALEPPDAATLSIATKTPINGKLRGSFYEVKLESTASPALIPSEVNRVNPETLQSVFERVTHLAWSAQPGDVPFDVLENAGCTIAEDVLGELATHLKKMPEEHLKLQLAPDLTGHPWELMRPNGDHVCLQYAVGRQVVTESAAVRLTARSSSTELKILLVANPLLTEELLQELAKKQNFVAQPLEGATEEGKQLARLLEDLDKELNALPKLRLNAHVGESITKDELREWLREGYDIVHFAGHARFLPDDPETSSWLLSDGEMWATELYNTIAASRRLPFLIVANACESAAEAEKKKVGYERYVHGLASAFIYRGVRAYVGSIYPVHDGTVAEMAADFYRGILLQRQSIGIALRDAKRALHAKTQGRHPAWFSFLLYGDPTQRMFQG